MKAKELQIGRLYRIETLRDKRDLVLLVRKFVENKHFPNGYRFEFVPFNWKTEMLPYAGRSRHLEEEIDWILADE